MDWLSPYDYELPDERIARSPAEPRDESRLLVMERRTGNTTFTTFRRIVHFLRPGDLLVLNETKVLPARLYTRLRRTGRRIEVLLSHPEEGRWLALLGPGRRLRAGDVLEVVGGEGTLVLEAPGERGLWRLRIEGVPVRDLLLQAGHVPLPPYLKREDEPRDRRWYQTVYARVEGSVAAPTAGLHFTAPLLREIEAAGVGLARVILHVGPGTFLPVRASSIERHEVLAERYEITAEAVGAVERTRSRGGRVIAVGTTTVRALESAAGGEAGRGTKSTASGAPAQVEASPERGPIRAGSGWTGLTILPEYRFRAVDALITNFHLPRSSLLLLVAAFAGRERVLEAYAEARDAGFRFYSYGDAMFIH